MNEEFEKICAELLEANNNPKKTFETLKKQRKLRDSIGQDEFAKAIKESKTWIEIIHNIKVFLALCS